jgi:hypothetical protein
MCAELGAPRVRRYDLSTQSGISREQPKGNQAVRLAAAHGQGEIERAVFAFSGKPLKPAPDQKLQTRSEVIALEEYTAIDFAGRKILNLRHLFHQAVTFHNWAGGAQLLYSGYWHSQSLEHNLQSRRNFRVQERLVATVPRLGNQPVTGLLPGRDLQKLRICASGSPRTSGSGVRTVPSGLLYRKPVVDEWFAQIIPPSFKKGPTTNCAARVAA